MQSAYIYKITSPTGRIYIGSTFNVKKRWAEYHTLKFNHQSKLKNSFLKYGIYNHKFEVIEECFEHNRYEREAILGNEHNCLDRDKGLNLRLPKINDIYECVSGEIRLKISEKAKLRVGKLNPAYGNKRPDFAKMAFERGKKLVGDKNPMFGTKRPEHVIDAVRKARLEKEKTDNSPRNKIVIDINTGIFYKSAMEVILLYGFKKSYFVSMLNGQKRNKTQFKYA